MANSDEFKTLFSKALKRGESLIVKNWASLYENELIVKKENSEEESYNFNYYSYDDIPLFINVFCKNSEEIDEEISQNILSREEKNMKTYINGKVDLNQDNVEEEISFISQVPEEDIGTDSNSETEAKLVINNKTFEFIDLLSLAGIEEGDLY
ncbi:MAG: hypothetical protein Q4A58_02575 [Fusobacterium sp.]|uniref:hypothetical protein n=1 Tax=Fusobacterium sp. TaxID=68766 RepID=UPI0026DDB3D7|nr:hypothetical protein [Fusobacterium sp.]MDO4690161.1 hypothetical protein [Fusobacterium sp.]